MLPAAAAGARSTNGRERCVSRREACARRIRLPAELRGTDIRIDDVAASRRQRNGGGLEDVLDLRLVQVRALLLQERRDPGDVRRRHRRAAEEEEAGLAALQLERSDDPRSRSGDVEILPRFLPARKV